MIRIMIFCLFGSISLHAQEWAPIGAVWHYSQDEFSGPGNRSYFRYESVGDTIFQGRNVRILEKTFTSYNHSEDSTYVLKDDLYFFEDSSRVYYYLQDTFKLLYDFLATEGDTISIGCPDGERNLAVVVDSIGRLDISGHDLKLFYVHTPWYQSDCIYHMSGEIIEKIGWKGYLFPQHLIADPPEGGALRCYSDDILGEVKFSDLSCDFINTPIYDIGVANLKVYPNPTMGILYFDDPQHLVAATRVYDAMGRRVVVREKGESSFDLSSLLSGYYTVLLIMKNGGAVRTRVLKAHR